MIEVKVSKGLIDISGHADYAEPGKDIICAAFSMLVQNFYWSVNDFTDDCIVAITEEGQIKQLKLSTLSDGTKLLIQSFALGVTALAENYPENINIVTEGALF